MAHTDPVAYHRSLVQGARNRLTKLQAELDQQLALVTQRRQDWQTSQELFREAWWQHHHAQACDEARYLENYRNSCQLTDDAWFKLERASRMLNELNVEVRQAQLTLTDTRTSAVSMLTMSGYDQFLDAEWLRS